MLQIGNKIQTQKFLSNRFFLAKMFPFRFPTQKILERAALSIR